MSEIELINQRKGYKVQAKLALTKLEKLSDAELKETFNVKREKLVSYLDSIQKLDSQILRGSSALGFHEHIFRGQKN
ncbi:MAG: hypothetical protein AAGM46_27545, partial [Cyanobacteria bacterium J06582_2]